MSRFRALGIDDGLRSDIP